MGSTRSTSAQPVPIRSAVHARSVSGVRVRWRWAAEDLHTGGSCQTAGSTKMGTPFPEIWWTWRTFALTPDRVVDTGFGTKISRRSQVTFRGPGLQKRARYRDGQIPDLGCIFYF